MRPEGAVRTGCVVVGGPGCVGGRPRPARGRSVGRLAWGSVLQIEEGGREVDDVSRVGRFQQRRARRHADDRDALAQCGKRSR
eukprot:8861163-Lingulodinium_polyedra.AAC.1